MQDPTCQARSDTNEQETFNRSRRDAAVLPATAVPGSSAPLAISGGTTIFAQIRPAIVMMVLFTILTGGIYPLVMTGIAQYVFPTTANGSLIQKDGKVIGWALIGQNFTSDKYFQGRPSAITDPDPKDPTKTIAAPYDADNSVGSNLGPTSKPLVDRITASIGDLRKQGVVGDVPADAVTTSGSGLDPDIYARPLPTCRSPASPRAQPVARPGEGSARRTRPLAAWPALWANRT